MKAWKPYLLLIPFFLLIGMFFAGIINALVQSFGYIPAYDMTNFTLDYYKDILGSSSLLSGISLSIFIAVSSSVGAAIGGTLLAWCLVESGWYRKHWYRFLQLPILVPHTVVAFLLISLIGGTGFFPRICMLFGWERAADLFGNLLFMPNNAGVILGYMWKEIPFVSFFVISVMAAVSPALLDAAKSMGAGKWACLRYVILPQCRSAIGNAFIIVFAYSFGAYELPMLLGSTLPKALPILTYNEYLHPDLRHRPYAMVLNVIMIAVCLGASLLFYGLFQKNIKKWKGNSTQNERCNAERSGENSL